MKIDHKQMNIIEEEKTIILSEILVICLERKPLKTCCPSEVARKLYPNNWREKMDLVRQCAQFLVEYGYILSLSK